MGKQESGKWCMSRIQKFCYLGDMLSGRANSASVASVCWTRGKFSVPSGILTRMCLEVKSDIHEEFTSVWKQKLGYK